MALLLHAAAVPVAAQARSVSDRFDRLQAQDLRVASVAYRLSVANADNCAATLTPQLGFVLHVLEQYGGADRAMAASTYGLGDGIGVMAVVSGSPADRAGLVTGDRLLLVNGHSLPGPSSVASGSARIDRAHAILTAEMRGGAITLRVVGRNGERNLRLTAESGCSSTVEFVAGGDVNAWADGNKIMIGEGLLRRCVTDDDLALVIGHEMAHNRLHHRKQRASTAVAMSLLPNRAGADEMRAQEEDADRLAVILATRAGYALSGVERFLGTLLEQVPSAPTYPQSARRLALLRAAIADSDQGVVAEPAPVIGNTASSALVSGNI